MNVTFGGRIFGMQQYGGVSLYFTELALALAEHFRVQVKFASPLYINNYLHKHRRQLKHQGLWMPMQTKLGRILSRKLAARAALRLNSDGNQIYHETYYEYDVLSKIRQRKISTFYDMIHERFGSDSSFTEAKKKTYDASDHCIAISEATKRDMVEYLKVSPEKITVVHLAANWCEPALSSRLARLLPDGDQKFILWVGPRGWYKNFEGLLKAYATTDASKNGIRIVCAGEAEPKAAELESWKEFGVDPSDVIHLIPTDSELAWLYSHALLMCYASLYEGFGIPPLEAMSHGCPVTASNAGSIPEVVGEAAVLFDPTKIESIADALTTVMHSEAFRQELVAKGMEQVKLFHWQKCAEETYRVYQNA